MGRQYARRRDLIDMTGSMDEQLRQQEIATPIVGGGSVGAWLGHTVALGAHQSWHPDGSFHYPRYKDIVEQSGGWAHVNSPAGSGDPLRLDIPAGVKGVFTIHFSARVELVFASAVDTVTATFIAEAGNRGTLFQYNRREHQLSRPGQAATTTWDFFIAETFGFWADGDEGDLLAVKVDFDGYNVSGGGLATLNTVRSLSTYDPSDLPQLRVGRIL